LPDKYVLDTFAAHLKSGGKATKVVLTASTRKLLVTLNTMLKYDTPWNPKQVHSRKTVISLSQPRYLVPG
jgi:hypothetical protein